MIIRCFAGHHVPLASPLKLGIMYIRPSPTDILAAAVWYLALNGGFFRPTRNNKKKLLKHLFCPICFFKTQQNLLDFLVQFCRFATCNAMDFCTHWLL